VKNKRSRCSFCFFLDYLGDESIRYFSIPAVAFLEEPIRRLDRSKWKRDHKKKEIFIINKYQKSKSHWMAPYMFIGRLPSFLSILGARDQQRKTDQIAFDVVLTVSYIKNCQEKICISTVTT
jgi:hypothetical protein